MLVGSNKGPKKSGYSRDPRFRADFSGVKARSSSWPKLFQLRKRAPLVNRDRSITRRTKTLRTANSKATYQTGYRSRCLHSYRPFANLGGHLFSISIFLHFLWVKSQLTVPETFCRSRKSIALSQPSTPLKQPHSPCPTTTVSIPIIRIHSFDLTSS